MGVRTPMTAVVRWLVLALLLHGASGCNALEDVQPSDASGDRGVPDFASASPECAAYCDTAYYYCGGSYYFTSGGDCGADCARFGEGAEGDLTGDSIACREGYLVEAKTAAHIWCPAASPSSAVCSDGQDALCHAVCTWFNATCHEEAALFVPPGPECPACDRQTPCVDACRQQDASQPGAGACALDRAHRGDCNGALAALQHEDTCLP